MNFVQEHCARCRERGRVTELERLPNEHQGNVNAPTPAPAPTPTPDNDLDRRFSELVREADVADALDEKRVDGSLPALLRAGLTAFAEEKGAAGGYSVDPPLGRNPSLHARLRQVVDVDTDDEVHWSFRAVLNQNAVAALYRLRAAMTASGLELPGQRRRLFILRNAPWSQGPKTRQALDGLRAHGGTGASLLEGRPKGVPGVAAAPRGAAEGTRRVAPGASPREQDDAARALASRARRAAWRPHIAWRRATVRGRPTVQGRISRGRPAVRGRHSAGGTPHRPGTPHDTEMWHGSGTPHCPTTLRRPGRSYRPTPLCRPGLPRHPGLLHHPPLPQRPRVRRRTREPTRTRFPSARRRLRADR